MNNGRWETGDGKRFFPLHPLSSTFYLLILCFILHHSYFIIPPLAEAVPPPPGSFFPNGQICRVNRQATQERASVIKAAPFFPTTIFPTTANVVVIRIQFGDVSMSVSLDDTRIFYEKVKNFYLENSFGILTVSATITNLYTLGNRSTYAGGINSNWDQLAKDALAAADAEVNFANLTNSGGKPPHLMLFHPGPGAETTGSNSHIWSVFVPTVPVSSSQTEGIRNGTGDFFRADNISFNGVTVVPAVEANNIDPLGVICHEYGHQLGLPDLYNAQGGGATVVGKWSVMDAGVYLGTPQGSNPAHLDGWSKQFLGFSSPQTVSSANDQTFTIAQAELPPRDGFIRIPIDVSSVGGNNEYFLLEYRRTSGATYDTSLPGQGLLIWHIDDSIASNESRLAANSINSGNPNLGVKLVTANDFTFSSSNQGDGGNPWPGSTGKTSFATPKSDALNGKESGIVVSGISGAGSATMSFNVTKLGAASAIEVASTRVTSYPNPASPSAVKGSRAGSDTLTTLVLQLARPFKTAVLTIHNLAGELVRNVPQSEIQLQAGSGKPSEDNKWVYEFNWNGKNDDGDPVSPGVYLYRFKLDDSVVKTGKLVIIR